MARPFANSPITSLGDSEVRLLAWLATCVSVFSFLFFYQRGDVLLYGDAVAHINIARRMFDSKTPGLLQLGTVWLPLPHLLMIPFLISNEMWRRGWGGSIPSMAGYVFGVVGIFRLVRSALSRKPKPEGAVRIAAWSAALVYAANPNLIYIQDTAMGEAVYLAFCIWAVVYFNESLHGDSRALIKSGLCVSAACLTRYDGWVLAAAMAAAMVVRFFTTKKTDNTAPRIRSSTLAKFLLIATTAPAVWLAYNGIVYRNPLEFENGPYSAKAIERRTQGAGNPGHPGSGHLLVAGLYFVKSATANVAENLWLQRLWVVLGFAAVVVIIKNRRPDQAPNHRAPWLPLGFLLLPVPFYALSVAYGGVPIFIPAWWPFAHYNVRYGLQLLPAFAVAIAVIVYFVVDFSQWNAKLRLGTVLGICVLVTASYASVWYAAPICLAEAQINMRTRNQLERQLAGWLAHLPPDSTLLMYLGDHVGALQQAGVPLRRVINEGNHRVWKQPVDPDGLWERALANPAVYADYVVAFEGDPVWQAVQEQHLRELVEIHVTGQARAVLYRAR